jgi:hypothetical protein
MTPLGGEVWLLWHLPGGDPDEGMLIGVYESKDSAIAAVERLRDKPGFRENPGVVEDDDVPGFFMQAYELDKDHWTEGYQDATLTHAD